MNAWLTDHGLGVHWSVEWYIEVEPTRQRTGDQPFAQKRDAVPESVIRTPYTCNGHGSSYSAQAAHNALGISTIFGPNTAVTRLSATGTNNDQHRRLSFKTATELIFAQLIDPLRQHLEPSTAANLEAFQNSWLSRMTSLTAQASPALYLHIQAD